MFYDERVLAIRQEQLKDQAKRNSHRKLLQAIRYQRSGAQIRPQDVAGWFGLQMKKMGKIKKWGSKLQPDEAVLSPKH